MGPKILLRKNLRDLACRLIFLNWLDLNPKLLWRTHGALIKTESTMPKTCAQFVTEKLAEKGMLMLALTKTNGFILKVCVKAVI